MADNVTFYFAENAEFHLGEYHENLTLEEAMNYYDTIPAERLNGIKAVGFKLENGDSFDILAGKMIDVEMINSIPDFRDNPAVQKAVMDVIELTQERVDIEVIGEVNYGVVLRAVTEAYRDSQKEQERDTIFPIRSAVISNYKRDGEVYNAFVSKDDKVFLGKQINYDNQGHYNDNDNSLILVSENARMYQYLYGDGWSMSQDDMAAFGDMSWDEFKEWNDLRAALIGKMGFEEIEELKFAGQPFYYSEETHKQGLEIQQLNEQAKGMIPAFEKMESNKREQILFAIQSGMDEKQIAFFADTDRNLDAVQTEAVREYLSEHGENLDRVAEVAKNKYSRDELTALMDCISENVPEGFLDRLTEENYSLDAIQSVTDALENGVSADDILARASSFMTDEEIKDLCMEMVQGVQAQEMDWEPVYYAINESMAKQAKMVNSFQDYVPNSATQEYRREVDSAYELAAKVAEKKPGQADRAYNYAERYSRKLADWYNKYYSIEASVPSIMIAGGGNFDVRRKHKQNSRRDNHWKQFDNVKKIKERITNILYGKEIIKSGDKDAVDKLKEKVAELEKRQQHMKDLNAYYRKHHTVNGFPDISDEQAKQIDSAIAESLEKKPYASYQLSNNRQNLATTKKRLEQLEKAKEKGTQETQGAFFKTVENTEIMRLQLIFEGKPDVETRDILKSNGFRWSPKNRAWQRQLNNSARYSLKRVEQALAELHPEQAAEQQEPVRQEENIVRGEQDLQEQFPVQETAQETEQTGEETFHMESALGIIRYDSFEYSGIPFQCDIRTESRKESNAFLGLESADSYVLQGLYNPDKDILKLDAINKETGEVTALKDKQINIVKESLKERLDAAIQLDRNMHPTTMVQEWENFTQEMKDILTRESVFGSYEYIRKDVYLYEEMENKPENERLTRENVNYKGAGIATSNVQDGVGVSERQIRDAYNEKVKDPLRQMAILSGDVLKKAFAGTVIANPDNPSSHIQIEAMRYYNVDEVHVDAWRMEDGKLVAMEGFIADSQSIKDSKFDERFMVWLSDQMLDIGNLEGDVLEADSLNMDDFRAYSTEKGYEFKGQLTPEEIAEYKAQQETDRTVTVERNGAADKPYILTDAETKEPLKNQLGDVLSFPNRGEALFYAEQLHYTVQVQEFMKTQEPTVTILWSENPYFKGENIEMPLSEADNVLRRLNDITKVKKEYGYDKTTFEITFLGKNGESSYGGRYDIGTEGGGLVDHIKDFTQYYIKDAESKGRTDEEMIKIAQEVVPYLENHQLVSHLEMAAQEYLQRENLSDEGKEKCQSIMNDISSLRGVINSWKIEQDKMRVGNRTLEQAMQYNITKLHEKMRDYISVEKEPVEHGEERTGEQPGTEQKEENFVRSEQEPVQEITQELEGETQTVEQPENHHSWYEWDEMADMLIDNEESMVYDNEKRFSIAERKGLREYLKVMQDVQAFRKLVETVARENYGMTHGGMDAVNEKLVKAMASRKYERKKVELEKKLIGKYALTEHDGTVYVFEIAKNPEGNVVIITGEDNRIREQDFTDRRYMDLLNKGYTKTDKPLEIGVHRTEEKARDESQQETREIKMPSYYKDGRFYINAPYKERYEVKKLGGYWDVTEKKWYFTNAQDKPKFKKWLSEEEKAEPIPENFHAQQPEAGELKGITDSNNPDVVVKMSKTDALVKKLEEGTKEVFTSEKYANYLSTMSKLPSYSFNNSLLIWMANPNATIVTTYSKMHSEFGYNVNNGEHGIQILRPNKYSKSLDAALKEINRYIDRNGESRIGQYRFTKNENGTYNIYRGWNRIDAQPFQQELEKKRLRAFVKDRVIGKEFGYPPFLPYTVFDISQASPNMIRDENGNKIIDPKAATLQTTLEEKIKEHDIKDVATLYEAAARISEFPVTYNPARGGEKGYFSRSEGRINITPENEPTQALKTLVHELTHSRLHNEDTGKSREQKETEAESVAYVVCQYYGIDTADYSFGYLAAWASGKDLKELQKSLSTIQKEAYKMIAEIDKQLEIVREIDIAKESRFLNNEIFKDTEILKELEQTQETVAETREENRTEETEKEEQQQMPDETVSIEDMNLYGYAWEGMLPLSQERALELVQDIEIYRLFKDGAETIVNSEDEIKEHDGLFGVESKAWITYLERQLEMDTAEFSKENETITINGVELPVIEKGTFAYGEEEKEAIFSVVNEDNVEYWYATVDSNTFEYDQKPDIAEVEESYINLMAEMDINRHEAVAMEGVSYQEPEQQEENIVRGEQDLQEQFPVQETAQEIIQAQDVLVDIYQVKAEKTRDYAFESYENLTNLYKKEFTAENYDHVVSFSLDTVEDINKLPDEIYTLGNMDNTLQNFAVNDAKIRSISVSDVIILQYQTEKGYTEQALYVDSFGFRPVESFLTDLNKGKEPVADFIKEYRDNPVLAITKRDESITETQARIMTGISAEVLPLPKTEEQVAFYLDRGKDLSLQIMDRKTSKYAAVLIRDSQSDAFAKGTVMSFKEANKILKNLEAAYKKEQEKGTEVPEMAVNITIFAKPEEKKGNKEQITAYHATIHIGNQSSLYEVMKKDLESNRAVCEEAIKTGYYNGKEVDGTQKEAFEAELKAIGQVDYAVDKGDKERFGKEDMTKTVQPEKTGRNIQHEISELEKGQDEPQQDEAEQA